MTSHPAAEPSPGSSAALSSAPVRWWPVLLALAGFLVLPLVPTIFVAAAPIIHTWMLLAGALAICAALAWWNGGGIWLAGVAAILIVLVVGAPLHGVATKYALLARGWVLVLAASFGVASLLTPSQGFFPRALVAVGIATAIGFVVAIASPGGVSNVHDVTQAELTRRTDAMITFVDRTTSEPEWRKMADQTPALDSTMVRSKRALHDIPAQAASLVPALLALESLAALALAWAVFHRLPVPGIGPGLGELRQFRFNDQLVWGLAVGATIALLPVFADGRMAGMNLLVFFGALYLLRGVGVLSWMARAKWVATLLIVLTLFGFIVVGALALGVGVVDTWMDWRSRGPRES